MSAGQEHRTTGTKAPETPKTANSGRIRKMRTKLTRLECPSESGSGPMRPRTHRKNSRIRTSTETRGMAGRHQQGRNRPQEPHRDRQGQSRTNGRASTGQAERAQGMGRDGHWTGTGTETRGMAGSQGNARYKHGQAQGPRRGEWPAGTSRAGTGHRSRTGTDKGRDGPMAGQTPDKPRERREWAGIASGKGQGQGPRTKTQRMASSQGNARYRHRGPRRRDGRRRGGWRTGQGPRTADRNTGTGTDGRDGQWRGTGTTDRDAGTGTDRRGWRTGQGPTTKTDGRGSPADSDQSTDLP